MGYVIMRVDGKFAVAPGQESAYTDRLQDALVYRTKEAAERNRCPENETVVRLDSLLQFDTRY